MLLKTVNAIITVLAGVGAALVLYWILNKLSELLPGRWEERLKPYAYILPAYLAITFYLIFPAVQTIVFSFKDSTSTSWVGTKNYTTLLGSHNFQQTVFTTLLWMVVVPAVTVAAGLGIAVLADQLRPRAESLTKTVIFMPMAISMVGASTVWLFVYAFRPKGQPQVGVVNALADGIGGSPVALMQQSHFHLNSLLLMVMLVWAQAGFSMVLLSAAIKGVPSDTLEAARIDGASERQSFFQVVVPQIKGTIITVFVTTLITVMKVFDVVYVMTNGNFNTNVVGLEFFNQLFTNFDSGKAAAIVVLLMIAIIPVMAYQVRHYRAEEAS